MKIVLSPEVSAKLEAFCRVYPKEFSGFGWVERTQDTIQVYAVEILDIGNATYTEISAQKSLELMNRPDAARMKLWFHYHPIDFWSNTDIDTILNSPLGGIPQLVKWSASIVMTPRLGWIGRIDNYITHKTMVVEVEPNPRVWALEKLNELLDAKFPHVEEDYEELEEEDEEDPEDDTDLEEEDDTLDEPRHNQGPFRQSSFQPYIPWYSKEKK